MTFKILVCGGRDFGALFRYDEKLKKRVRKAGLALEKAEEERNFIFDTLDELTPRYARDQDLKIINGGAYGADNVATEWAIANDIEYKEYHANWKKHKKLAGPIRNQLMLNTEIRLDDLNVPIVYDFLVIAFPGDNGTKDMIRKAKRMGIKVIEVKYER